MHAICAAQPTLPQSQDRTEQAIAWEAVSGLPWGCGWTLLAAGRLVDLAMVLISKILWVGPRPGGDCEAGGGKRSTPFPPPQNL